MKILLTGANGYIGKRLLPVLIEGGHQVVCCVRDRNRYVVADEYKDSVEVIEVDFLQPESLKAIPAELDVAYYLIHSMSSASNYDELEAQSAHNFVVALNQTHVKQVIYLGGIVNEAQLSRHLLSRKHVEDILTQGTFHLTVFRAGIIIGSGSASFEIIRDLVEKLPVMVTPKWLNTRCQPIGIRAVIQFLSKAAMFEPLFNKTVDIGGPDVLTYKQMLLIYAKVRGLRRWIFTLPVMTPRLSSYWLYFITSTSYRLATALVNSMKIEVVCRPSEVNQLLNVQPATYEEALERTFRAIESHQTVSSWKDALVSGVMDQRLSDFIQVPEYGCFRDQRSMFTASPEVTLKKLWNIGGTTGWYYGNWLWKLRGIMDKFFGGVGLRRGRSNPNSLKAGDALDFWRVLVANKAERRLLLFAEMKLPGEAWLEFRLTPDGQLHQTATFRPKGLAGRLYWYAVLPFHGFVFKGMLRALTQ